MHCDVFPIAVGWGSSAELADAFMFPWPPCQPPIVDLKSAAFELLEFEVTWHWNDVTEPAIVMSRRLARGPQNAIVAFHDLCFVSESLPVPKGFAAEMLRRCIPLYSRFGIRTIAIPSAVWDGRLVWPRFGFAVIPEAAETLSSTLRSIMQRNSRPAYEGPVPLFGPDLLGLKTEDGMPIGEMALMEIRSLSLELDLENPQAVRCLQQRGITVR